MGFLSLGIYSEKSAKILIFTAIGTFFLLRILNQSQPFLRNFLPKTSLNKALYLFFTVAGLATIFSASAYESQKVLFGRYLIYFAIFFTGAFLGREKRNSKIVILLFLLSSLVVGLGGLTDAFKAQSLGRLHTSFGFPLYGAYFLYVLPFFAGFIIFHPLLKIKFISLAAGLPVFAAFVLHGSRGVWLGFLISLFCLLLLGKGKRFYLLSLFFLLTGLIFSFPFTRQRVIKTVAVDEFDSRGITSIRKDSSVQARIYMWQAAININRKYPLLGAGPGRYGSLMQDHYPEEAKGARGHLHAHSTYFEVLADMGILGLLSLLWLLVLFFQAGRKALQKEKSVYTASFLMIFFALAVSEMFMSVILVGLMAPVIFWFLLGLGMAEFEKYG